MLGGVFSGAVMGIFFHQTDWLGGYPSYRRRLFRLGHISFFGLGFLNMFFALGALPFYVDESAAMLASNCFIAGVITMPICCFLAAWHSSATALFVVPVLSVMVGVVAVLIG
jgi:hypothetical protein